MDKESSFPLCEIHCPNKADAPIMPGSLAEAFTRMIEEWNHADELAALNAALLVCAFFSVGLVLERQDSPTRLETRLIYQWFCLGWTDDKFVSGNHRTEYWHAV